MDKYGVIQNAEKNDAVFTDRLKPANLECIAPLSVSSNFSASSSPDQPFRSTRLGPDVDAQFSHLLTLTTLFAPRLFELPLDTSSFRVPAQIYIDISILHLLTVGRILTAPHLVLYPMPLFKRKMPPECQRILESKLHIARESRDSVFDLSDCNLSQLPRGVESQVRVFQKTILILHGNCLQRICNSGRPEDLVNLVHLDLHANQFSEFPPEILMMHSLQILNMSHNKLRSLPTELGGVRSLRTLNFEDNSLSSLPDSLGDLKNLHELYLAKNPLQALPVRLGCLRKLKKLTVPLDSLLTPQRDVCEGGISAILSFLRRAGNIPDKVESKIDEPESRSASLSISTSDDPLDTADSAFYAHQLAVKRRHNENLHKELVAAQRAEALAAQRALKSRNAVLHQLVEEGSRNDAEVCLLQQKRDARRQELLSSLRDAESHADELIRRLSAANEAACKREAEWEAEQTEVLNHNLATGLSQSTRLAILDSMQETLRASEAVIARQNRSRENAKQKLHTDKVDSEKALAKVLASRSLDKLDLTARVADEEAEQKEAFRRLQQLRDMQSQRIIQEIRLVEQELCRLTQAEQERKRASSQLTVSTLAEQRGKLLQLLQSLQKAKERRETELQNRLVELEARKLRDQTDYWLVQYQRLMDKKPTALLSEQLIDPDVYKILEAADAMDYAANFEYHRITSDMLLSFTDADLVQVPCCLLFL
nr:unnamed protein product [Spirometra erinaceieuropaei]